MSPRFSLFSLLALLLLLLPGCKTMDNGTTWQGIQSVKISDSVKAEEPGDYWIGRRYYKVDYKFWGYVKRPGQPWSTAKLVMMNEQSKLAPDRALGHLGSDNGYEYKLIGDFSGDTVYEPASDGKYPEFVLKNYSLRSISPVAIFREPGALDPTRRLIVKPVDR